MLDVVLNYWTLFKKCGYLWENSSLPLVSQASYGPDTTFMWIAIIW